MLCPYTLWIVLYMSICDKGHLVIKVKRNCQIAVSNQSYNELITVAFYLNSLTIGFGWLYWGLTPL